MHQLDLDRRGHALLFILQAVAGADFNQFDTVWERHKPSFSFASEEADFTCDRPPHCDPILHEPRRRCPSLLELIESVTTIKPNIQGRVRYEDTALSVYSNAGGTMNWFTRLFSSARVAKATPASPVAVTAVTAPTSPTTPSSSTEPAAAPSREATPATSLFVPWLSGQEPLSEQAMTAHEQHSLEVLQAVLALPSVPDKLLPRAAKLIPQLIVLLRETQLPLKAIAQRVSKDPLLAAEVLRLASSPFYRAQGDVTDLQQGIALIGSTGLQASIARVVLKPIYRSAASHAGSLHGKAMAQLWEHSTALAERAAVLAEAVGLDSFDGYLLGMLHDTGWKVTLASLDSAKYALVEQPTAVFVTELVEHAHRLFALAAQRWQITPGFTAFTADARENGLANGTHPMTAVLQQALQQCAPVAAVQ